MKHYNTPKNITTDLSNIKEEHLKEIYKIAKVFFQNKKAESLSDHMIYNAIRNKPVFHGIHRIKQNRFYDLKYYHQSFSRIVGKNVVPHKENHLKYVCYESRLMREIRDKSKHLNAVKEIAYQIGKPLQNANINDEV